MPVTAPGNVVVPNQSLVCILLSTEHPQLMANFGHQLLPHLHGIVHECQEYSVLMQRCTKFFEYYFPLIVSFTSEILEPVFLQKDTSNGYAWYFHRYHNPRCMGRICFPQKCPLICSTDHILYYCIEYQSVKNTSQDIQYLVPVQCMSILIARYNAMSSYDDHPCMTSAVN
jgi:hypothetical protein